jgi:son of sevenless-like protein
MIDTAFFQAFVLTFRSFTSGDELMDLLLERYNIQPPPGLNAGEMIDWTKQKQTPIRLRYVVSFSSSSFQFF